MRLPTLGDRLKFGIVAALVAASAPSDARAATGAGDDSLRPLGTLWYPGPYSADQPGPATVPIQTPIIVPAPPIAVQPIPAGAHIAPDATSGRPLGTLWYPGLYELTGTAPAAVPTPTVSPPPIPVRTLPTQTPAALQPSATAPIQPVAGQSPDRPLGILWVPTPFDEAPRLPSVTGTATPPTPVSDPAPPSGSGEALESPQSGTPTEPPIRFSADEMSIDRERGIVTASGNVAVGYGERTLVADKIIYDQKENLVIASGRVMLQEPGGEKVFGDYMQATGDLKDAVIRNIGIILADRSRIVGTGARRTAGIVTDIRNAVYSPCNLCDDDPDSPPLWQLKAVKVVHDKNAKTVEYRDAWLEVVGVPVAYTPYFRHPDPTVKRQSGFLVPSFGNSSDLGATFQVPYFWNISPHEDMTITPLIFTDEVPALDLEYRKSFESGTLELASSITDNSDDNDDFSTEEGSLGVRGHIDAEGRFDIDDTWRWGFDAKRTSDDTYLRRYGFSSPQSLNSRLFAEGFRKQNYFAANAYAFQGLEASDEQDQIPLVLPLIDFNHVGNRDRFGGRTKLDVNFLSLSRAEGTDTRRFSVRPLWERPFQGSFGDVYNFQIKLDADFYHVNSLARSGNKGDFSGLSHRLVPLAALDWRMPFVKTQRNVSQILEPIASIVWSPNGGNPDDIPNEDSTELEFDETNLFSTNRFAGLDQVEGGIRLNYGLKWGIYGQKGGSTSVFIGQTYRPRTDGTFAVGSGLEDNLSDLVARIDVAPAEYLNLKYRTRFSPDSLSPNRNEFQLNAGVPAFRVSTNYIFLDRQQDSEFAGREQISFSATSQINRFWRGRFNILRDIADSETRSAGINLVYENECVLFTTSLTRTFFQDRDLEPTDTITFRLNLKTLGEVNTGFSRSQNAN